MIITTFFGAIDQINFAAEANRGFSKILRDVQGGSSYVVTGHGKSVARIGPFDSAEIERAAAWEALLERPTRSCGRRSACRQRISSASEMP